MTGNMRQKLTNLQGFVVVVLLIAGAVALSVCTGCATQHYAPQTYEVKAFTLIVGSPEYVQSMWEAKTGRICCVGGFYEYETRTMYVERDKWHPERPVFEYFGHEVWHLPELGGRFHK